MPNRTPTSSSGPSERVKRLAGPDPDAIQVEVPEPLPGTTSSDYFNGDNAAGPGPHDNTATGPSVNEMADRDALEAEAREIALRRPDAIMGDDELPGPDPEPVAVNGRLGADLGSLEVIKATFRTLIPDVADEVVVEYAWVMGLSDVVGRMLGYHRQGQLADPALVADLKTLALQIDHAREVETR